MNTDELRTQLETMPLQVLLSLAPASTARPPLWSSVTEGQRMGIIPIGTSKPKEKYIPMIAEIAQKRLGAARAMPPMTFDEWAAIFNPQTLAPQTSLYKEFSTHCARWLNVDLPTTALSYDAWAAHWEDFTDVPF